jgi:hypothetical protein
LPLALATTGVVQGIGEIEACHGLLLPGKILQREAQQVVEDRQHIGHREAVVARSLHSSSRLTVFGRNSGRPDSIRARAACRWSSVAGSAPSAPVLATY